MNEELYQYTECGLDFIYLRNGFIVDEDSEYGRVYSVLDAKELHKVIACEIAKSPRPLSGQEIRFLRKEMNLSQKRLADILDVTEQTVARWEKEENKMSKADQLVLRSYYLERECNGQLKDLIDRLAELDTQYNMAVLQFEKLEKEKANIWRVARTAA